MRILHIRIENFGCLSDFDLDLSDGNNVVLQKNGWGKSTLAAFVRAMFYGLNEPRKKDLLVNDKTHYTPWNNGYFGGEIKFSTNGKEYVVSRNFGSKNQDSDFHLFDAATGIESKDYSAKLGEELFGINCEAFRKTCFINQALIRYEGVNSEISSKVSPLAQTDDLNNYDQVEEQMKDYLNANSPKRKTGKLYILNNEIQNLKSEIKREKSIRERIDNNEENIRKEEKELGELKKKREEIEKQIQETGNKKELAALLNSYFEIKEKIRERKKAVNNWEKAFGEIIPDVEYPQNLTGFVSEASQCRSAWEQEMNSVDDSRYERLTKYFKDVVPSELEIIEQIDKVEKVQKLISENEKHNVSIETKRTTITNLQQSADELVAEKRKNTEKRAEKEAEVNRQKAEFEQAKARFDIDKTSYEKAVEEYKKRRQAYDEECRRIAEERQNVSSKKGPSKKLLTISIVLLVIGVLFEIITFAAKLPAVVFALAAILIVVGIILLVLAFVGGAKNNDILSEMPKPFEEHAPIPPQIPEILKNPPILSMPEENNHYDEEIQKLKNNEKKCNEEIQKLNDTIETNKQRIRNLEEELRLFFERYELTYSRLDAREVLYEMKGLLAEYKTVLSAKKDKEEQIEKLKKRSLDADEKLMDKLREIKKDTDLCLKIDGDIQRPDYSAIQKFVSDLTIMLTSYENAKEELSASLESEEDFRNKNPEVVEYYEKNGEEKTVSEPQDIEEQLSRLSEELKEVHDAIDGKNGVISSYGRDLDGAYSDLEEIDGLKQKLEEKTELYDDLRVKYALVEKTKEYLQKSKESFIARFMSPIKDSFDKYFNIMASNDTFINDFRIDANMTLTKKEEGSYHSIEAQSSGYSDMIGLCIRMALMDVMYDEEKPMVIMDDPFVNLDKEHLAGAKEFLKEVSKEYQILYFTCHEDRSL